MLGLRWAGDGGELRQRLGIQLQETQLADKLTVFETLRLFRSFFRQGPAVSEVIALVQLRRKAARARGCALGRSEAATGHGVRPRGRPGPLVSR